MLSGDGYVVVPDFADTAALLDAVERYAAERDLPVVNRPHGDRPLRYQVIDGHHIARHLPALVALASRVRCTAEALAEGELVPLADTAAALNVNITPPGGSYRWHYDRNPVTAVLYLNDVVGGELQLYPRHRLFLGRGRGRLQRVADRLWRTRAVLRAIGRRVSVEPRPGLLVVMRGDRCLHNVAPMGGVRPRICVVMAFAEAERHQQRNLALDTYLYSTGAAADDPNYRRRWPPRLALGRPQGRADARSADT